MTVLYTSVEHVRPNTHFILNEGQIFALKVEQVSIERHILRDVWRMLSTVPSAATKGKHVARWHEVAPLTVTNAKQRIHEAFSKCHVLMWPTLPSPSAHYARMYARNAILSELKMTRTRDHTQELSPVRPLNMFFNLRKRKLKSFFVNKWNGFMDTWLGTRFLNSAIWETSRIPAIWAH